MPTNQGHAMIRIETTTGETLLFQPDEKALLIRYGVPRKTSVDSQCEWGAGIEVVGTAEPGDWIGVGNGVTAEIVQVVAVRKFEFAEG